MKPIKIRARTTKVKLAPKEGPQLDHHLRPYKHRQERLKQSNDNYLWNEETNRRERLKAYDAERTLLRRNNAKAISRPNQPSKPKSTFADKMGKAGEATLGAMAIGSAGLLSAGMTKAYLNKKSGKPAFAPSPWGKSQWGQGTPPMKPSSVAPEIGMDEFNGSSWSKKKKEIRGY